VRTGWVWGKHAYLLLKLRSPASAAPNSRNSKTKNFLFLFEKKLGARYQKKCRENFSVLGRKLLQSLRAEAGRRLSRILKKSSSFGV